FSTYVDLGRTNYVGVGGLLGTASPRVGITGAPVPFSAGLLTNRSQVRMVAIRDGSSNTLLFGEAIGGEPTGQTISLSWMGCGSMVTAYGMTDNPPAGDLNWERFSSQHTGVVQFCFADGSVRPVVSSVGTLDAQGNAPPNYLLFNYLAGYSDGQAMD